MNNIFNFKSYLKFLSKNISYTAIDVFGLSISLLFVIIIAIYTNQELSTDNFQENADRIYAMADGERLGTAYRIGYRVQEQCPEVEKVCPVVTQYKQYPVGISEKPLNADLMLTDTTFFTMFSFDLLVGDRNSVLASQQYAVISETFAKKAFPGEDAMGKQIQVHDSVTVTINGIMKDIKNSVIPYADIIFRIENVKHFNWSIYSENYNNAGGTVLFVMTKPGADIHAKEDFLVDYFKGFFWYYKMGLSDIVQFIPLNELHFSPLNSDYNLRSGDWNFVMILLSIGVVILIFAIINYINLTVAQTGFRAKEMATRRLMGSSRTELFLRLILESILLTFFSFVIALLLVKAAIPYANDLLETKLYLNDLITLRGIILSLLIILLIGAISGILPALVISNSKPIDVVKGGFRQKTKMVFSKFFITFQNIITITLIGVSLTMVLQINHMIKAPLGYNTANIIDISTHQFANREQISSFTNEIRQLAAVKDVGLGQGTPFSRGNNNTVDIDGVATSFQILAGDSAYFNMFGFEILKENHNTNPEAYYVNEETFRFLGLSQDVPVIKAGQWGDLHVAGVLRNFKLRNVLGTNETIIYQFYKTEDMYPWDIVVDVQGDHQETFDKIQQIYMNITGLTEFPADYIEDEIAESFSDQRRISRIVIVFCFVAILISSLGLLAMSTYFIQQKAREVAVRKVFGSSNTEVLSRLVFTFLNYVIIAFIIACPVIWYFMDRWLADYSYRIALNPLIFIAAGLFCMIISFTTVFCQSYIAANSNPAENVKVE